MKRIIAFSLIFLIGCASLVVTGDTKVIDLPKMGKTQIYQKAMQWLSYKFVSGKAVIDYKDPVSGRLIAKGSISINHSMGSRIELFVVATIDCIAGKTKIVVEPAECSVHAPNGSQWPCTAAYMPIGAKEDIILRPRQFVQDYETYMTGGRAPAWDGR